VTATATLSLSACLPGVVAIMLQSMSMHWTCSHVALASLGALALACSGDDAMVGVESTGGAESSSGGPSTTLTTATTAATTDGMSTTTPGESSTGSVDSSSSSGAIPDNCGDGHLDDGEACDDGNDEEGDACHVDCTLSFEVVWTAFHNGESSNSDAANDVWIDGAGNVYVLGSHTVPGTGSDVWLQQYMPDGSEGATFTFDGPGGGDDHGNALAVADDGDFLVAGDTESTAQNTDILVLRVPADLGEPVWQTVIDGPGAIENYDGARDVVPSSDGGLVISGHVWVDEQGLDAWVAKLDEAGTSVWSATHDDAKHGDDSGEALVLGADDGVLVFGGDPDPYERSGFVQAYDADGVAQGDAQIFDFYVHGAVADGDGGFVVAGYGDPGSTVDAIVRKYDASFAEQWAVEYDGAANFDFGYAVQLDAAGNVYLVGISARTGEQDNGFVAAYDGDGNPLWGDQYNTVDVDLGEAWNGVAIDPDGDVVVAGYATLLGHQSDAFVRKYHAL
jgi:cysteine-rich repeat protein